MSEPAGLVEGFCTPRFDPLRQLFRELIESGQDLGASLAYVMNKLVPQLVCPNITALATCFYGIIGG